jgi:hypothetical protein
VGSGLRLGLGFKAGFRVLCLGVRG